MTTTTAERPAGLAATATLTHGFTMADVEHASRVAVRMRRRLSWHIRLDDEDEEQAAWYGIVEYLYACGCGTGFCNRHDEPTFQDLLKAGTAEIGEAVKRHLSNHGLRTSGTELGPNYVKFWLPPRRAEHWSDDGFSDQICDRIALREALGALTVEEYEAVVALAVFDARKHAAEALGVTPRVFDRKIGNARARIKEVWTGDVPAEPTEPTCKRGHPRATEGRRDPATGAWVCRACRRAGDSRRQKARTAARGLTQTSPPAA